MSLRKGFSVFGTQRFDLRLEAFNILNRTRLGNAVTNPTLPDFGFITFARRQPHDADRHAVRVLSVPLNFDQHLRPRSGGRIFPVSTYILGADRLARVTCLRGPPLAPFAQHFGRRRYTDW